MRHRQPLGIVAGLEGIPPNESDIAEDEIGGFNMELLRDTWCLGMSSVESSGIPTVGLYLFSSTSPIDRENTVTRWALRARTR